MANKWVLLILLVVQTCLLYQDYFVKAFRYGDPVKITILGFFFFIIGMVATRNQEKIHKFAHRYKYLLLSALVALAFYVFWEGRSGYLATENYLKYYSQWRPSVLAYTILTGLVLFRIFEKPKFQLWIVGKLSKQSFLVFFVHVIVLEKVWSFFGKSLFEQFNGNVFGKIVFDSIFFGIVIFGSFFVAYLTHKIPKLYKLTG